MPKLIWEHSSVREVAALLLKLNPHFAFSTADAGADYIKRHVERTMDAPGYLSIYGFCATVWADEDYRLHVKVTVEPHTVAQYLANN